MASLPTPGASDVWGADLNAAIESLHLGPDTHANRPTTGLTTGTLYSCSDHDLIYRWSGSAWATYATLGGTGLFRGEWMPNGVAAQFTFSDNNPTPPPSTAPSGTYSVNALTDTTGTPPTVGNVLQQQADNATTASWRLDLAALGDSDINEFEYYVRTSTETGYDYHAILVNGVAAAAELSGINGGWVKRNLTVGPSDVIELQYHRDASGGWGTNSVYYAQITVKKPATAAPYMVGQYVIHDGGMWRSTANSNTSEPGASSSWVESPIGDAPAHLGYDVQATGGSVGGPLVVLKKVTVTTALRVLSVDAYVAGNGANVASFSGAIYTDVSGSPDTVVAATSPMACAFGTSRRWLRLAVDTVLSPGDYWLAVMTSAANGTVAYDAGGTDRTFAPSGSWWHDQTQIPTVTTTASKFAISATVLPVLPA